MGAFLSAPEAGLLNGISRQPALALTINGSQISEILSVNIHQNNFLGADHFSVVIAITSGTLLWAQADTVQVDLRVAQNQGSTQSLITGLADEIVLDVAGGTVMLKGRDYTAQFIESKTAEKFQNLTSSQVVSTLAARNGFNAQVTTTTTPTGKYYDSDHAIVTNQVSEWTLLSYLAEREGFDIFFEGSTLFFQPAADPSVDTPFDIFLISGGSLPVSNIQRLTMHRSLTLAHDIIVKVISWNHEIKTPITAVRRAQKVKGGVMGASPPTTYVFREPGMTQTQAQEFAQTKLNELTLHERRIEFDIPGDLTLTPRSLVRLTGTNTDFDQIYFVAQMNVSFTLSKGFTMRVTAKNASPHMVVFS